MGNFDREDAERRCRDADQDVRPQACRPRAPFAFEPDQRSQQRGEKEPRCNHREGQIGRMGEFFRQCAHRQEAYLNSGSDFRESLVAPGSTIFLPSVFICS